MPTSIHDPAPPRQSATLPGDLVATASGWRFSREGRHYRLFPHPRFRHVFDVDASVAGRRGYTTIDITMAGARHGFARHVASDEPDLAAAVARDLWLCSMSIRLRLVDLELQVPGEMPEQENLELSRALAELPVPRERRLDVTCFGVPAALAEDLVERVTAAGGRVRFRETA